jgi:hypothetical protein
LSPHLHRKILAWHGQKNANRRERLRTRGHSITMNGCVKIIRTIAAVRPKIKIRTRVSDGQFGSEIVRGNKAILYQTRD